MRLTKEQKRAALAELRMDDWGDPWGTTMSHMFGIADVLYHADADIPCRWAYRHGPGCDGPIEQFHGFTDDCREAHPDEGDCVYPDASYVPFLDAGELGIAMLLYAGNVCDRMAGWCTRAGRNY